MIRMRIDRPMSKDDIRLFRLDQRAKFLISGIVHLDVSIDLSREHGARLENLAGLFCFRRANLPGFVVRLAANSCLAAREIENSDAVAKIDISRDRSAAAGFRIIWMGAGDEHLQRASPGFDLGAGKSRGES